MMSSGVIMDVGHGARETERYAEGPFHVRFLGHVPGDASDRGPHAEVYTEASLQGTMDMGDVLTREQLVDALRKSYVNDRRVRSLYVLDVGHRRSGYAPGITYTWWRVEIARSA